LGEKPWVLLAKPTEVEFPKLHSKTPLTLPSKLVSDRKWSPGNKKDATELVPRSAIAPRWICLVKFGGKLRTKALPGIDIKHWLDGMERGSGHPF
jgi:hypothetical protein